MEDRRVDAVVDQLDPARVDAALDDVIAEGAGVDDDAGRAAVEPAFEAFERTQDGTFVELAELDDRFRPEVAHLQHEGTPLHLRDQGACHAHEELRTGRHDEIGPLGPSGGEDRGGCEEQVVRHPTEEAGVRRQIHPGPDHPNAVDLLLLDPTILVALEDATPGMVGDAGHDGDVVTVRDPAAAMLVGPVGGRVHLGRKVVGDEENLHGQGYRSLQGFDPGRGRFGARSFRDVILGRHPWTSFRYVIPVRHSGTSFRYVIPVHSRRAGESRSPRTRETWPRPTRRLRGRSAR